MSWARDTRCPGSVEPSGETPDGRDHALLLTGSQSEVHGKPHEPRTGGLGHRAGAWLPSEPTPHPGEVQRVVVRRAFGQYRPLLGEVTFSPTMGQWLTYLRNRAAYESNGNTVLPDENYAREVTQLFSFGLIKRNLDFSPQLNSG